MICEICSIKIIINEHHIQSLSKKGNNKKWNKINICPNCHRLIHIGEIIIEGKFLTTDGYKILWHYKDNKSITTESPEVFNFYISKKCST